MNALVEVDSGSLVSRAAAGEQEAWGRLVDRFGGMVLSVARGQGLNSADAADVSQTVWLRLVEHLAGIEDPERVGGWLAITTRRESRRVRRNSRRHVLVDDDLERPGPAADPDSDMLALERDRAVAVAWSQLSPRCRQMLAMLFGDERSNYKQLSAALDMPGGSIGPTRSRCLECLRRLYESSNHPERPLASTLPR